MSDIVFSDFHEQRLNILKQLSTLRSKACEMEYNDLYKLLTAYFVAINNNEEHLFADFSIRYMQQNKNRF